MSLHSQALEYSSMGFAVFPLAARSKRPIVTGGVKAATRDVDQITTWWGRHPNANVAIATGSLNGLLVLDMDPRNNGEESHREICEKFGRWSNTPIAHTGGGGTHEFFRHPGDGVVPCRTNLGGFKGIDLKGDGGYVVAPPSIHPSGRSYIWDLIFGLDSVDLPEPPPWLIRLSRDHPAPIPGAYASNPWDGTVPERVMYCVAVSDKVARRFYRDPSDLIDSSPSGVDYSLACLLAAFPCSGATIEAAFRASRAKAGLPPRRESYFRSTIGKALALAKQDRRNG